MKEQTRNKLPEEKTCLSFGVRGYPSILENSRSAHAGAHTAMEMANGHVAITRELLAAEPGEECEPPPDEADWEC